MIVKKISLQEAVDMAAWTHNSNVNIRVCHIGKFSLNLIGAYDFLPLKSIVNKAVKEFFQTKQY